MSIYVEKTGTVYGEGYGVRFESAEGGTTCQILMVSEDGTPMTGAEPIMLNWDVAHRFGHVMAELAGERR